MLQKTVKTRFGDLCLVEEDEAIVALRWGFARHEATSPLLEKAARQLEEYDAGARQAFDLPLRVTGSDLQRAVCDSIHAIPFGGTVTYGDIAKIFRAGCIIRAQFLQKITDAYAQDADIANLLLAPYFKQIADEYQQALRDVVSYAVQNGIPTPTFSAAISYYDSYRSAVLPANLIQAQRDYFGAHTYKRIDKEGVFHTEWME